MSFRALGHHSPPFTLDVYAHLLDGEEPPALDLAAEQPAPPGVPRLAQKADAWAAQRRRGI